MTRNACGKTKLLIQWFGIVMLVAIAIIFFNLDISSIASIPFADKQQIALAQNDENNEYYIIKDENLKFTHSSVKGDFRIHALNGGFCVAWKEFIVARDMEGRKLWDIKGFGRAVAISPDGKRGITSNGKTFMFFDTKSGKPVQPIQDFPEPSTVKSASVQDDWFFHDLIWLKSGQIIAWSSDAIAILDESGTVKKLLTKADLNRLGIEFLSGIAPDPSDQSILIAFGGNSGNLIKFKPDTLKIIAQKTNLRNSQMFFSLDGETLILETMEGVALRSARSLNETFSATDFGYSGVKRSSRRNETAWVEWTRLSDLSPNSRYLLAIDGSGQLWCFDTKKPSATNVVRVFERSLLNYVYDVMWTSDREFIAILNQGGVIKMSVNGTKLEFVKNDFEPSQNLWIESSDY
ncbi:MULTISPECIES: hypothetical protein [Nostocales]|uniref:WD40 repeat-containing protein n=3 Tax=Nostocales TaxID=1161 RepID=A0A0C1MY38_9CYAN|nr:hypothetical protein [Tolypothrix bouteillei]KAF3889284.1 hypothetical protein DA73_0400030235 [Tolypothrix bouteillei VB521301]